MPAGGLSRDADVCLQQAAVSLHRSGHSLCVVYLTTSLSILKGRVMVEPRLPFVSGDQGEAGK